MNEPTAHGDKIKAKLAEMRGSQTPAAEQVTAESAPRSAADYGGKPAAPKPAAAPAKQDAAGLQIGLAISLVINVILLGVILWLTLLSEK